MVDDDDALAERLDVGQVVRRQEHRRALLPVDLLQELAHVRLGDDVEADGGLVQEEQGRPVEQGRREVAAHPLAQRELADGLVEIRVQAQDLVEERHPLAVVRAR